MSRPKLRIRVGGRETERALKPGLTRVGAADAPGIDVPIEGAIGELHVWDDPPKVVRVRGDEALVADGDMSEEFGLKDGDAFAWAGAKFVFSHTPVLEEIEEGEPVRGGASPVTALSSAAAPGAMGLEERRAYERMLAGLFVETGIANKKVAKRWQNAVMNREWDADACAREVIESAGPGAAGDPRVVERAGRLERDFLMASLQRGVRGATRRARGAARSTTAFFVANVFAILVYSAIILALLLTARWGYDWSIDAILDRIIGVFRGGSAGS